MSKALRASSCTVWEEGSRSVSRDSEGSSASEGFADCNGVDDEGDIRTVRILVTDIEWDTDDEEIDLPGSIELTVDEGDAEDDDTLEHALSDALSDQFGWCHLGFSWQRAEA